MKLFVRNKEFKTGLNSSWNMTALVVSLMVIFGRVRKKSLIFPYKMNS